VLNAIGESVLQKTGISQSISTKNLKDGLYLLKTSDGMQKKFIVKH